MSLSAFGVEHGDFSKGLPRAVADGKGGPLGSSLRMKNAAGKTAAKYSGDSPAHGTLRRMHVDQGKQWKAIADQEKFNAHMKQYGGPTSTGSKTSQVARSIRARLLTEDGDARRRGYKTGKSSALDRHYRGRVNDMKPLP